MVKTLNRAFGAFDMMCSNDSLTPNQEQGVIINGAIWVTDSHALVKSNLNLWSAVDEESIPAAHGKSIHRDKLKTLSATKTKKIVFTEEGIEIYQTHGSQMDLFLLYDSKIVEVDEDGRELWSWLDIKGNVFPDIETEVEGKKVMRKDTFIFPKYEQVLPKTFLSGYDTELYPMTAANILNPHFLVNIGNCFANDSGYTNVAGVKILKFWEENNRPFIILPNGVNYQDENYLDQFGLVMPVFGM